jgi:hypothetical protein
MAKKRNLISKIILSIPCILIELSINSHPINPGYPDSCRMPPFYVVRNHGIIAGYKLFLTILRRKDMEKNGKAGARGRKGSEAASSKRITMNISERVYHEAYELDSYLNMGYQNVLKTAMVMGLTELYHLVSSHKITAK